MNFLLIAITFLSAFAVAGVFFTLGYKHGAKKAREVFQLDSKI